MRCFYILLVVLTFLIIGVSSAETIKAPPKTEDREIGEYLKILYRTNDILTIVTVDPNGSRNGRYGELVILATGSILTLKMCISSPDGTNWQQVQ